jgi:hypothetical protein
MTYLVTIAHNKMRYCLQEETISEVAESVLKMTPATILAKHKTRITQWEKRKGPRGVRPRIQVWKLVEDSDE